jgi:hypothetical protein
MTNWSCVGAATHMARCVISICAVEVHVHVRRTFTVHVRVDCTQLACAGDVSAPNIPCVASLSFFTSCMPHQLGQRCVHAAVESA